MMHHFDMVFHCLPYMATRITLYGIMEDIGVRDLEFWESVRTHTKKPISNWITHI